MLGTTEIIVILLVVLLLFGGKKLPELARSLGQGIREFKKASREINEEVTTDLSSKNVADTSTLKSSSEATQEQLSEKK